MSAAAGRVMNQAHRIRSTTVSFRALKRLAAPTPMIEALMAWVVETGMPKWAAVNRTVAAVVSAANPWTGWSLTILWPIVLMMRQPPAAVPAHMVRAQRTLIQTAMSWLWP